MAWEKVKLKISSKDVIGHFKCVEDVGELHIPNMKVGESINIAKKQWKIVSSLLDERDDILKLSLAMAGEQGEKSDGKSIKRSD